MVGDLMKNMKFWFSLGLISFLAGTVLLPQVSKASTIGDNEDYAPRVEEVTLKELDYENKTVQDMIAEAKINYDDLVFLLEGYSDETYIISYGGGFFTSEDTSEPFVLEMFDEDEITIKYRDDNPSTVGEVREAIRSYNNG